MVFAASSQLANVEPKYTKSKTVGRVNQSGWLLSFAAAYSYVGSLEDLRTISRPVIVGRLDEPQTLI